MKHFQKLNASSHYEQCSSKTKSISLNFNQFQRHKKQPSSSSISSITTNLSSLSNEINDNNNLNSQFKTSKLPGINNLINKTTKGIINNLNPFKPDTNNLRNKNGDKIKEDNSFETEDLNQDVIYFPLASHLFEEESEKILIHQLMRFIVETLLDDIVNNEQLADRNLTLKLLKNSKTFKALLVDVLSIALFNFINKITEPKTINAFIITMVKRYAVMKNLFYDENSSSNKRRKARFIGKMEKTNMNEDDDDDDEDFDNDNDCNNENNIDNNDDNDDEMDIVASHKRKILKKDIFFLEEIKQCILMQEFDHLLELIDKCQSIRLLKQVRFKLIAEILDATVVLHLNRTKETQDNIKGFTLNSNDSDLSSGKFC